MRVDLHTHTTASDGQLSPPALIRRAREHGVTLLSITDHDTVAAYDQIDPSHLGDLQLLVGAEFSTTWRKIGIHVLSYGFDRHHPAMIDLVATQTRMRQRRVQQIADQLDRLGFPGALSWLQDNITGPFIGRPHFARFLVATGAVVDEKKAFKKYLGAGKPGDIKGGWASLELIIEAVNAAGGKTVLAHPDKYQLTNTKLRRLLADFAECGGDGVEVVSGWQTPERTTYLASLAESCRLLATTGSDFHQPDVPWREVGKQSELPSKCRPLWHSLTTLDADVYSCRSTCA